MFAASLAAENLQQASAAPYRANSGTVELGWGRFHLTQGRRSCRARQKMKLIFQDPYSSLKLRMTVMDIIGEPIDIDAGTYRTKRQ